MTTPWRGITMLNVKLLFFQDGSITRGWKMEGLTISHGGGAGGRSGAILRLREHRPAHGSAPRLRLLPPKRQRAAAVQMAVLLSGDSDRAGVTAVRGALSLTLQE